MSSEQPRRETASTMLNLYSGEPALRVPGLDRRVGASEFDQVNGLLPASERTATVVLLRGFQPGDPCPDLLTEEEAIRYLRLDTIDIKNPADTLRRCREMNMLRGTQISKKVFYRRSELDQLITNLTDANPR
jgi:hypothetical protein